MSAHKLRLLFRDNNDFLKNLIRYLKEGVIDKRVYHNYLKQYRFKQDAQHFTLENNRLFAFPDDLQGMGLEVILTELEKKTIIEEAWGVNGFFGADRLYDKLKYKYLNITKDEIRRVINSIQTKQLLQPFKIRVVKPIVEDDKMVHWEIDLIDFSILSQFNKGINYLLTIIDVFSKFAFVIPVKNKEGGSISSALEKILLTEGAPKIIQSDNGLEFKNHLMDDLSEKYNFELRYSQAYRPQTNGAIERFNRTIKEKLNIYMLHNKTKRYIDVIDKIVFSYNNSKHSSTKYPPFVVHRESTPKIIEEVRDNIQKLAQSMIQRGITHNDKNLLPLNVGDRVRIALLAFKEPRKASTFAKKAGISNWTEEVYQIIEVKLDEKNNLIYKTDFNQDERHYFFRYELMKVDGKKKEEKEMDEKREEEQEEEAKNEAEEEKEVKAVKEVNHQKVNDYGKLRYDLNRINKRPFQIVFRPFE